MRRNATARCSPPTFVVLMTSGGELRSELSRRLVPALQALGFHGPAELSGNALLHDFRRPAPDGTHVVTVQLEKHGRPRFVVNLTVEPIGGFDPLIENGGIVLQGRLKPGRSGAT